MIELRLYPDALYPYFDHRTPLRFTQEMARENGRYQYSSAKTP